MTTMAPDGFSAAQRATHKLHSNDKDMVNVLCCVRGERRRQRMDLMQMEPHPVDPYAVPLDTHAVVPLDTHAVADSLEGKYWERLGEEHYMYNEDYVLGAVAIAVDEGRSALSDHVVQLEATTAPDDDKLYIVIWEGCDHFLRRTLEADEAIEALQEAIKWIESQKRAAIRSHHAAPT
jgi:hypothetical protein